MPPAVPAIAVRPAAPTLGGMHGMLLKLGAWLLQKLAAAAAIVLLALLAYGAWLWLQEEGVFEQGRVARLQAAVAERDRLLAARTQLDARLAAARAEVEKQQQNAKKAAELVARLRELESWWDRWFGNSDQQTENAAQMRRLEALKNSAAGRSAELQQQLSRLLFEQEGLDSALRRANAEVAALDAAQSRARQYARLAWDRTKGWIALALAAYFFGPTLWALLLYYGVARWMAAGRPIRLGGEPAALPAVGKSRVSLETALGAGEVLRVKEKFLQASDEGLVKRTRFVLDWRIPFTSAACGLVELLELQPPAGPAAADYRATLSNGEDPHVELALVEVPAGASLVLRPSFLAGVILPAAARLEIRRHWRIFRWQAWIGGQFRFFEFVGPCRLVVAGSRGVRAERLAERAGQTAPARRTNRDATIGFTPNLDYRPVRAETFWSYYRGMNPLFDDLFAGRGLFLLQETSTPGDAARAGKFWSGVWSGVLKVFGL